MLRITKYNAIAAMMIAFAVLVPAAQAQPADSPGVGNASSAVEHQQQSAVVPNEGGFTARSPVEQQSGALPNGIQRTASGANPAAPSHPTNVPSTPVTSSGFDWSDAGIGAGAMLLLVSVSAGGVVAIRRSRGRGQPALTA